MKCAWCRRPGVVLCRMCGRWICSAHVVRAGDVGLRGTREVLCKWDCPPYTGSEPPAVRAGTTRRLEV